MLPLFSPSLSRPSFIFQETICLKASKSWTRLTVDSNFNINKFRSKGRTAITSRYKQLRFTSKYLYNWDQTQELDHFSCLGSLFSPMVNSDEEVNHHLNSASGSSSRLRKKVYEDHNKNDGPQSSGAAHLAVCLRMLVCCICQAAEVKCRR